jgi:hemerythrin-like domain-containing protein
MPKRNGVGSVVGNVRDAAEKIANGVMAAMSPADAMTRGGEAQASARPVDAIDLLKKDHAEVKALFAQANELSDTANAARVRIFKQIADALTLHTQVEETIFYPAFKAKTKRNTDERDEVLEAYEEHASAKDLIAKILDLDARDETYKAKVQVLSEMIAHHVEEEESTMFPEARELLGDDEIEELGAEIQAAKEKAKRGARTAAPRGSAAKSSTAKKPAAKSPATRGGRATTARPATRRKTAAKKR